LIGLTTARKTLDMPNHRRFTPHTKSKAEIRDELSREMDSFLRSGGNVENVPVGVSGNEKNNNLFSQSTSFEPRKDRTPVTDVVKELEARKRSKNAPQKKSSGPRKRLITDDFGEPIRWVWEE